MTRRELLDALLTERYGQPVREYRPPATYRLEHADRRRLQKEAMLTDTKETDCA